MVIRKKEEKRGAELFEGQRCLTNESSFWDFEFCHILFSFSFSLVSFFCSHPLMSHTTKRSLLSPPGFVGHHKNGKFYALQQSKKTGKLKLLANSTPKKYRVGLGEGEGAKHPHTPSLWFIQSAVPFCSSASCSAVKVVGSPQMEGFSSPAFNEGPFPRAAPGTERWVEGM